MFNKNSYIWAGLGLLIAGSVLFLSAYFVLNVVWLMALGICMLILSFILLVLGRTIPNLSPEVCSLLLDTGVDNIAAIVEELGIRTRAIYLPSSLTAARPQALVPLHDNPALPRLNKTVPQRLIVRFGTDPDDIGLLLSTVGSAAVGMLGAKPSPSATGLEEALTSLLIGTLGVADGVKALASDNHISVTIRRPHLENRATWSHHCLGSPLASIAACVTAEAWDRPVVINQEVRSSKEHSIELEVIP